MTLPIEWYQLDLNAPVQASHYDVLEGGFYVSPRNWYPLKGRLLPRDDFKANVVTSLPDPPDPRGAFVEHREGGQRMAFLMHYDGTNFDLWSHPFLQENLPGLPAGAWTSRDANISVGAAYREVPFVAFATGGLTDGTDILYYGNPGFTSGRGRYIDGGSGIQIGTDYTAGLAAAYHLNRFWCGGAADFPNRLKFTEIGDITNWNTSENFIPVGADNVPIYELVVWDRGLLIGKPDGLWWLGGSTLDSFQLIRVAGAAPVAAGRSMCVTPHGVYYLGTDGNLFLYDGGEVQRVNQNVILPSLVILGSNVDALAPAVMGSLVWLNDRLFMTGTAGNAWITDTYIPDRDRWYENNLGADAVSGFYFQILGFNDNYLMFAGPNDSALYTALAYMAPDVDGFQQDENTYGEFYAAWADVWPNPIGKSEVREIVIRYRQWDGLEFDGPNTEPLSVSVVTDRMFAFPGPLIQTKNIDAEAESGVYVKHLQFGAHKGTRHDIIIEHYPDIADQASYAILDVRVGVLVDADRR